MLGRLASKPLPLADDHVYGDIPNFPPDFHAMSNHPNRNPNSRAASPAGRVIRTARLAANLTPQAAGALVYERASRWMAFEADEARMHPATWELWQRKVAELAPSVTTPPGTQPAVPKAGETWYEIDTGAAFLVDRVEDGIVYAYGPRCFAQVVAAFWHTDYQREPVAV